MPVSLKYHLRTLLVLLSCFALSPAMASHVIGDEFTYRYLGDTMIYSKKCYKYEVTLNLYVDCHHGQPQAIADDNPAFFSVFEGTTLFEIDTAIYYSKSVYIPVLAGGPCGMGGTSLCVLKRTFAKVYYLPSSTKGYTIAYQRCCKNDVLANIVDPGNSGSTYFCTIPPSGIAANNTSAVFTNYPPVEIALNEPFAFDHSATDADGDSLSYELCNSYKGADNTNVKPIPNAPPYDSNVYVSPLSYSNPIRCSVPITIDPGTGILSGTPDSTGKYLMSVCCSEWRAGKLINSTTREFQFNVIPITRSSYKPFAGNDTTIYAGDTLQFNATGAVTYLWTPGTYLTSTSISNPAGHFPVPGTFTYTLHGISDSGCTGNDTIKVTVIAHSEFVAPNAFTPNGDGVNDVFIPFQVKNSTLISMKIYDKYWHLIYTGGPQNTGWDGTYSGKKQPAGAYYWQINYIDNHGVSRTDNGSITLIR